LILPPLPLTTGMLLSLPMILYGIWLVRTRGRSRAFV
jgi:hypothetical protein